jgi:hypothetical protein
MWLVLLLVLPILALLVLGLVVSAVIAVAAAIAAYLTPLLLILAGLWLVMRAVGGPYRPAPTAATQRPGERRPPARPPASPPRRELPIDVQVKAEQIRHKAGLLLEYADRFPPFSRDLYIVRQTAADYLPRTIAAYLAVPGVDDPLVRATGRTALEELRAQLALLDSSLDAITHNLQQRDLDGLLANRRFLEERFAADDGGLLDAPEVGTPRRSSGADAGAGGSGTATRSA